MSCAECGRLERRLRVLQSDFDFELRKLAEDKSTEKALFEIGLQKDIRKWQEKYAKERLDHEEDGRKWLQKIDSTTQDCERRVAEVEASCQQAIAALTERTERQISEAKAAAEALIGSTTRKLIEKHQVETAQKESHYQQLMESLKQSHAAELDNIRRLYGEREEKMRNEYESCILGLRSERNADERNNLKLQEEFRIDKTKLISEIYDLKYKISASEERIRELRQLVSQKQDCILRKEQEMAELAASHQSALAEARERFQRQLSQQESRMEERLREFYENELRITEKYEQSITKIEESRMVEMELYRSNLNEIRSCVESRPSRLEDVEEILLLRERLGKKEKELQALERELKDYQLQLENKEDTYNKIFIPTINSTHLPGENVIKRKELKVKRPAGRSVTTVREILNSVNVNSSNLPLLNNLDRKALLPPKSTKIL